MLNGSRLYYKAITCEKNSAFCSVLQGNPTIASPKERLYEQMTPNPAFTERNNYSKSQRLSPIFSSGAKIFGHISHSTELVHMCLACQCFDFNGADWISHNLHVISSRYLRTMERNLSFSSADVRGVGTRDQTLRTSAWEATFKRTPLKYGHFTMSLRCPY